jgi:hypothetical protein
MCALVALGCNGAGTVAESGVRVAGNGGGSTLTAPPPPPPLESVTRPAYKRGSLAPPYQLTPRAEYSRLSQGGVAITDDNFITSAIVASSAEKLDQVGAEIAKERGETHHDLLPDPADRQRARGVPFRGNPSDVEIMHLGGTTRVLVPLGGDVMTPGNEVAMFTPGDDPTRLPLRIRVGIRPQRVAGDPSGLAFVCNQYSNYVSIIDAKAGQLLMQSGTPVEVKTEYFCADVAVVAGADADSPFLYVANRWRHSVLKYGLHIERDDNGNPVNVTQNDANGAPLAEITGVGANPWRLTVATDLNAMFVANNKGGEVARIDLGSDRAVARVSINAPSADAVVAGGRLFVPTTMPDRGLLSAEDSQHPTQALLPPVSIMGLDGAQHVAHPGALFDSTRSYGFEDVRNGLSSLDPALPANGTQVYFTDDVSSEPNFSRDQKILGGALPEAIARNGSGSRIFLAMGGSDLVQELAVNDDGSSVRPLRSFRTGHRPFALAVDDSAGALVVANWGSETLDIFDLGSGQRSASIDLGYAQPSYPATDVERGEFFYYNADWSNNGRKACATCHFDELDTDGVGFANGATAPTSYHQVKPNHNLATTDTYFWNGAFANNNYKSLAFAAQTRTNCEVVAFALVEGPGSNPRRRIGDPNNKYTNGNDSVCRPVTAGGTALPLNFDQIQQNIAAEKKIAATQIQQTTGIDAAQLSAFIDLYSVSELRLPPNPLAQLLSQGQLDPQTSADIAAGQQVFAGAGCGGCHDPSSTRHPFTDGRDHGSGADWTARFINAYANDPRVLKQVPALPQVLLDGASTGVPDHEVNIYADPIDFFIPFCFDATSCLEFDDPLLARDDQDEESNRLDLLARINLADPDRGFIPGNVRGSPKINTPSLRGVWTQANLLHHGLAHTFYEAVLAPGHPALPAGQSGFAVDTLGHFDVHGVTHNLGATQVAQLARYLESIE